MERKNKTNRYIIRKIVDAKNISDALKKEKNSAVVEVSLVKSLKDESVLPTIGFSASLNGTEDE